MSLEDLFPEKPSTRRGAAEAASARPPRRVRVWPWILGLVGAVVVSTGAATLAFASEAVTVRSELAEARSTLDQVPALISAGDTAGLNEVGAEVEQITRHVVAQVDSPLWDLASRAPLVGQNVAAVQAASRATDILVSEALPVGAELAAILQPENLKLEGGGFDLEPFRAAEGYLTPLREALAAAAAEVEGIDPADLIAEVAGPLAQLQEITVAPLPALETVEQYLPTMLQMAGGEGPRTYLMVFQNTAETRATGGNPAASVLIQVDNGRFELVRQSDSAEFYAREFQSLDLPPEMLSLYQADTPLYTQNYNRTPDFPTTARMFESVWMNATGLQLDGVISIDPVVLSQMLEVTGPVTLDDGEQITADNALQVLLSDSYARFPHGAESDAFFAAVSARVFDVVAAGGWDLFAMGDVLTQAAEQQRVYMWMPRPEEQEFVASAALDGALATDNVDATELGIFLVDAAYSKLEYYLSTRIDVMCDAGARTATTTISMANSIPHGDFSSYVLGARNGRLGIPRTTMLLDVLFFAPPGGQIVSAAPDRGDVAEWDRTGVEQGRQARSQTIAVPMGATVTQSYTTSIPDDAQGPLTLRYTPTIGDTPVAIDDSCSGLFPAGH